MYTDPLKSEARSGSPFVPQARPPRTLSALLSACLGLVTIRFLDESPGLSCGEGLGLKLVHPLAGSCCGMFPGWMSVVLSTCMIVRLAFSPKCCSSGSGETFARQRNWWVKGKQSACSQTEEQGALHPTWDAVLPEVSCRLWASLQCSVCSRDGQTPCKRLGSKHGGLHWPHGVPSQLLLVLLVERESSPRRTRLCSHKLFTEVAGGWIWPVVAAFC